MYWLGAPFGFGAAACFGAAVVTGGFGALGRNNPSLGSLQPLSSPREAGVPGEGGSRARGTRSAWAWTWS